MRRKIDFNDRISVEIAIIEQTILMYNLHQHEDATKMNKLQQEENKLAQMKQQHPEYFI